MIFDNAAMPAAARRIRIHGGHTKPREAPSFSLTKITPWEYYITSPSRNGLLPLIIALASAPSISRRPLSDRSGKAMEASASGTA